MGRSQFHFVGFQMEGKDYLKGDGRQDGPACIKVVEGD